jgi:glycosyltransferase involved in cell wall biosynthesis
MKIAVSGYVSAQEGSVASANALLLRSLLADGHEVDFFSKPSFVDPRPCVGEHERFRFISTDNVGPDRFRAKVQKVPLLGFLACRVDCATYERLLLKKMRQQHATRRYDLCLWLGDYAPGRVKNLPMISFAQGPPGTDARSIVSRFAEIRRLAGSKRAQQWLMLAKLRLSRLGLPPLKHSDHIIVGSMQSKQTLHEVYGVPQSQISALPYPIDLNMFRPSEEEAPSSNDLRVLWLGRIIPRKRLDLFLSGIELAIRQGLQVKATIVGGLGFVPGYEKLIEAFPFPDRLRWIKGMPRQQVPALLHQHDVLIQAMKKTSAPQYPKPRPADSLSSLATPMATPTIFAPATCISPMTAPRPSPPRSNKQRTPNLAHLSSHAPSQSSISTSPRSPSASAPFSAPSWHPAHQPPVHA